MARIITTIRATKKAGRTEDGRAGRERGSSKTWVCKTESMASDAGSRCCCMGGRCGEGVFFRSAGGGATPTGAEVSLWCDDNATAGWGAAARWGMGRGFRVCRGAVRAARSFSTTAAGGGGGGCGRRGEGGVAGLGAGGAFGAAGGGVCTDDAAVPGGRGGGTRLGPWGIMGSGGRGGGV